MGVSSFPFFSSLSSCPSSLRLGVMMGSQSTLDLFLRLKRYHIAGPMRDCKGNEVFAEGNSVGAIGRVRWPDRAVE